MAGGYNIPQLTVQKQTCIRDTNTTQRQPKHTRGKTGMQTRRETRNVAVISTCNTMSKHSY